MIGRPAGYRRAVLLVTAAMALTAAPAAAQEKVNELLEKNDIEFVGIWSAIPDRQSLGQREPEAGGSAGRGRGARETSGIVSYAWDAERTPDDRSAKEQLLSVEHLRLAGIPAMPGEGPDFTSGMHGRERFRMAGVLTSMDIRGTTRYELKSFLDWQVYDTKSESVIWEGKSNKMVHGAVLGDRGEPDNVLLDSVLGALESVLEKEVPDAIKKHR